MCEERGRRLIAGVGLLSLLITNRVFAQGGISFRAEDIALQGPPVSITVGDFNSDGVQDFATANYYSNTVSVLLGNGDGSFQIARDFAAGGSLPRSVTIGDFNSDGVQDLAVANQTSNTVSVLIGNGDGSFQTALSFGVEGAPASVTVGDFNADYVQDLAAANASLRTVSVLLGLGDGSFQGAWNFAVGGIPGCVTIGDFNADGVPDLVTANGAANTVSVLIGNGDGSFQQARDFTVGWSRSVTESVTAGDFNADGVQDLAAVNDGYPSSVSVLLGNGDGSFQSARTFDVWEESPSFVTAGDFNADGVQDLVIANWASYNVSVLVGVGDGSFQGAQNFGVPMFPHCVAVGDFNGDGLQDLAVTNSGYVTTFINTTPQPGG